MLLNRLVQLSLKIKSKMNSYNVITVNVVRNPLLLSERARVVALSKLKLKPITSLQGNNVTSRGG